MKRSKRLPIPQREFGFTPDTFNLFQEWTNDGEQLARDREQAQKARQVADAAQSSLFQARSERAKAGTESRPRLRKLDRFKS